jgi:DNA polymerase mu
MNMFELVIIGLILMGKTAYPHKITHSNISEVVKLPYLGQKIGAMVGGLKLPQRSIDVYTSHGQVREFHETGAIAASTEIASSSRFQALSELASTHGVGPVTARKLYDLGLRSIDDARMYYNVEKCEKLSDEGGEENYSIKVGLAFAEELAMK